ncbi:MAG TPA: methylenetetrahydrofolate reductase [NAD(P)H] [Gammaproteobacteria bacterium]|jgi:methylenetetrahydrofolate reductase (NADPH)|nr:methylenetetrahydrofolate reductase [NAD(P)H] [Gammaproteobacteria bacterium]HIA96279.1 methylenetetrahydrofolate reductase [NAD(P)H] [Gammaproteobacteria bacterium]HIN74456.1 methylenetetrahydrofolate reductase [NAD(P)H] [Gammaproteobacteria bacterium]
MNTSFEFFPPKTEKGKENLINLIKRLSHFSPEYFSVTYGAAGSTRKGTLETCVSIKNLGQNTCPHLSGIGSSKSVIKEILNEFKGYGLTRVVALRGDLPSGMVGFGDFPYALDLIKFIKREQESFSIEVAAYPEVHPDAESENTDFENFLNKVEAGADGAITQFFFEEDSYFKFVEKCEKENVTIPIIPGIMPIHDFESLVRMAKNCSANVPLWLKEGMQKYSNNEDRLMYGVEVITKLCQKLLRFGAPGIHFYTVNREEPTSLIIKNLESK